MIVNDLTIIDDTNPNLSLITFINDEKRIFIECGFLEDESKAYRGFITISKYDAYSLMAKLREFIDVID